MKTDTIASTNSDMVGFNTDDYTVFGRVQGLPADYYNLHREHAQLVEEFDLQPVSDDNCFLTVQRGMDWPFLVIAHGYSRLFMQERINPGVLLVSESDRLFVGVHQPVLGYDLTGPKRVWEAVLDSPFLGWRFHRGTILMAAELELTARDAFGQQLWSTFVEPLWEYRVEGEEIVLTVMGWSGVVPLKSGPDWRGHWPWSSDDEPGAISGPR